MHVHNFRAVGQMPVFGGGCCNEESALRHSGTADETHGWLTPVQKSCATLWGKVAQLELWGDSGPQDLLRNEIE